MNKTHIIAIAVLLVIAASGCSDARKRQKEQAEKDRAEWIAEMKDSVKMLEQRIRTNADIIDELNFDVEQMLPLFKRVDNPRYVEGYYIMRDWMGRYPLSNTGIVARLMLSEQLELIAALKGTPFDRIEVCAGDSAVSSETVPYDQALNYRDGVLTTVAFSGEKADSVALFIVDHPESSDLKLKYYDGDKVKGEYAIPMDTRKMLTHTWSLYNLRYKAQELERQIPLDNRKLDVLRQRLETLESDGADKNDIMSPTADTD